MQAEPNPKVFEWLDGVPSESAWITAISVFELRYGIEQLATGRRRQRLQDAFSRVVDIDFHDRILPLDYDSAMATALIAAERKRFGRTCRTPRHADCGNRGFTARRTFRNAQYPPFSGFGRTSNQSLDGIGAAPVQRFENCVARITVLQATRQSAPPPHASPPPRPRSRSG